MSLCAAEVGEIRDVGREKLGGRTHDDGYFRSMVYYGIIPILSDLCSQSTL